MALPQRGALSEPLQSDETKEMELGKAAHTPKEAVLTIKKGDTVTSFEPLTKVPSQVTLAYTCGCMWRLVKVFWFSDDLWTKCKAWVMTVIVVLAVGMSIVTLVGIGQYQGALGTALNERNSEVYYNAILAVSFLLIADTCFPTIREGSSGILTQEWRKAISRILFSDYISPGNAFFQLRSQENDVDNPDQRIGQDVSEFTARLIPIMHGLTWTAIVLVVFAYQLWTIHETVGPRLLTAMFGTMSSFTFVMLFALGPPIMRVARMVLAEEGNLRFSLIRVRENAEPVAFYRGESYELARVFDTFRSVLWIRYRALGLGVCQAVVSTITLTFPNLLVMWIIGPSIIDGSLDFGRLAQTQFLFDIMMMALSGVLQNIQNVGIVAAQGVRVVQLMEVLDNVNEGRDVNGVEPEDRMMIVLDEIEDGEVIIDVANVTFQPPGFPVPTCEGLNMTLRKGESCLLAGPSGIGKSSILRCVAGLWTDGRGNISRCPLDDCFMLPQEAYLCLGTLRSNIIYPKLEEPDDTSGKFTDMAIAMALEEANLDKLLKIGFSLDEEVDLKGILSGGERQRLSFARLILRESMKLTILDEATSALDIVNEEKMYRRMMEQSDCFVSVGHRPTLDRFHTHRLLLEKQGEGKGATAKLEKLDPDNLPSAQLAAAMKARGEA